MSETSTKKLLFSFRHAPYGNSLAKEGIDAVLAASVYDQSLAVLFMDDGVFQLCSAQNPSNIEAKNIQQLLSAFELYDINDIYICAESLAVRGMSTDDLSVEGKLLSTENIHQLLTQQDHVLSF